jgi:hypothetical protein
VAQAEDERFGARRRLNAFAKISVHPRNPRMLNYLPPAKTFRATKASSNDSTAEVALEKLGIEHHIAQVL